MPERHGTIEVMDSRSAQVLEPQYPEKPVPNPTRMDKFGAHEKTDPREIALVRKLDRWIMVREERPHNASHRGRPIANKTICSLCSGSCIG